MDYTDLKNSPLIHDLVLRIGITGHRNDKLDQMERGDLNAVLSNIFNLLIEITKKAHEKLQGSHKELRPPVFRIYSPLADGADQIVATQAIKHGIKLECPLPFIRNDADNYGECIKHAAAILELDGLRDSETAFDEAGRMVLRHSDILIAIWDLQNARGPGGTANIVEKAEASRIPIIRIDPEKPHKAWLYQKTEEELLELDSAKGKLQEIIHNKLLLFEPAHKEHAHEKETRSEKQSLEDYLHEKRKPPKFAVIWKTFHNFFSRGDDPDPKEQAELNTILADSFNRLRSDANTKRKAVTDKVKEQTQKHYDVADDLANRYASLYNSGFVWNYFMSAAAVLFAFLGFGLHIHAFGIAEWFALLSIIVVYLSNKKHRWYDKRIDYRLLAELVRLSQFLGTLGRIPPVGGPTPLHKDYGDPSSTWVYWHFQGIIKQIGIPNTKFTKDYLKAVSYFILEETIAQAKYHIRKAVENENISHRLHHYAVAMFGAAFIGCFLHIFIDIEPVKSNLSFLETIPHLNVVLSFLSIVCPAFGAAFAAIRSHGEFERVARHSKAMKEFLIEKSKRLAEMLQDEDLNSNQLALIADEISEQLIDEVLDWRIVFHKRPIELA